MTRKHAPQGSGHKDNGGRPHVSCDPLVRFGEPCISWRLPAEQVAEQVWAGWTVEEHLAGWPHVMTRGHVLVACWFVVQWKPRTWRKRWGEWAATVIGLCWDEQAAGVPQYSTVPLPPTEAEWRGRRR